MLKVAYAVSVVFLAAFVMSVFVALPTMLLWNWLVPSITKGALSEVTFWQALGLNFLCGILVKSHVSNSK